MKKNCKILGTLAIIAMGGCICLMSSKIEDQEKKISDLERTLIVKQSHLKCVKDGRI